MLLEGALAAAPALAAGWVAHRGSPRLPFAPTALADRVIRLTPGDIATAAIDRLQHAAQPLLALSIVALFIAAGALIATRIGTAAGGALLWAMLVLGGGLAAPVERSAPGALIAAALGGAFYGASLRALRGSKIAHRPDAGRRKALAAIGTFTLGVLVASHPLARAVGSLTGRPRRLRASGLPRAASPTRGPFPRVPGVTRELTAVADHYVVDIDINDPVVDGPSWRLRVGGLVGEPLELGFVDLQREFTVIDEISVLTCISNRVGGPLVGCSRWEGPLLADVLRRARPTANATGLEVRCADGYTAGIPLRDAMQPNALLAIAQNGEALTREHGFPCRLRLPALYGMLNPKWVQSIDLVDHPYRGYWAQQGWSATAVVRTASRIDTPRHARAGAPTWIAGVAWAGTRGIARVEVSTDAEATWQPALLHRPLSPRAWTQWAYHWTPPRAGTYAVTCRAIDGTGKLQDARSRPPHPSGASGYHRARISAS